VSTELRADAVGGHDVADPIGRVRTRLRWWREVLYVAAFYAVYSWIRNRFGSETVAPAAAFRNARDIIDLEQMLHLYFEEALQDQFLGNPAFMRFWNIFYGFFHFAVTGFAMIWLYLRDPRSYPKWRNVLACTTALALVGFALFPLMPPRLLDSCGQFGVCPSTHFGYVDTLARYGGLWSFDSGTIKAVSNQFAAMPSLHFAWSFWCFLVLFHRLPSRTGQVLIALYPWLTLFAIVVTGNHYWIDALGGAVTLAVGYLLGSLITEWNQRRIDRVRMEPTP